MIIFTENNIINTEGFTNFRFFKYNDEEWAITCQTSVLNLIWKGKDKEKGKEIFDKIKVAIFNEKKVLVLKG